MRPEIDAEQRVRLCRGRLLQDVPLFGLLAMRLQVRVDPSCRDMWTDSVTLGFNPAYVDQLLDVELEGLMVHVTGHVLSGHPWRQGAREARIWNEAADLALNPVLKQAGYVLPKGSRLETRFEGMTAELVYQKLVEERANDEPPKPEGAAGATPPEPDEKGDDEDGNGDGSGDNPSGDNEDGTGTGSESGPAQDDSAPGEVRAAPGEAASPTAQAEWKLAIEHASAAQGSMSAGLNRLVKFAEESLHNWREELHDFVQRSFQAQDYCWSRPNRRYLHQGLYLPSRAGVRMPALVVARDTSGSVSDEYLSRFNANLSAIVNIYRPESVWVVDCDARVKQVLEITDGEMPETLDAKGGGGTAFGPVFDWVEKEGLEPACVVYFTDLQGKFPDQEPPYPVLWAVPETLRPAPPPPFGERITLRLD